MGMTCAEALRSAAALRLDRLDAQLLLLHALGRSENGRAWLLTHDDAALGEAAEVFHRSCLRRSAGEPLAYIVGHKEFFGLDLTVDARVLVPRPDTETLVQWALDLAPQWQEKISVMDLGTGSGAIALALAHTWQHAGRAADVSAIDASADALEVAQGNALRLGLPVAFRQSCWFEKVSGHFHLIVSNPPYVAAGDPHLPALRHEPPQALTAGDDGLDDIRILIAEAPGRLRASGWLLLEHGFNQAGKVCALLEKQGFLQVQSRPDLAGIHRCSGGQWPGAS